jgi:3alpha(or 20beta)-hydroxysteroid dehydrogenase
MSRLESKVALITGAARGQGEAEARRFAAEGAKVVVTDVLTDQAEETAASLPDAVFYPLDVTSESEWEAAVAFAVDTYGKLDVLVNNAGIAVFAPLTDTSVDLFRRTVDVNQLGTFLGMRTAVPAMKAGGSIINISSIDGLVGTQGATAYCATKFAVRGMTKCAALELGPLGIRVNSIHPGIIDTAMIQLPELSPLLEPLIAKVPLGRVANASEVAALAAFLASDDASYCTGGEFTVDGGMLAGPYMQMS